MRFFELLARNEIWHYVGSEIVDVLFDGDKNKDVLPRKKTVVVRLKNKNKEIVTGEFGWVDIVDTRQQLREGSTININGCFVEGFSATILKQLRGINEDSKIDDAGW